MKLFEHSQDVAGTVVLAVKVKKDHLHNVSCCKLCLTALMMSPAYEYGTCLDPDALVPSDSSDQVLKLLTFPKSVLCKLCGIGDLLCGRFEVLLLEDL